MRIPKFTNVQNVLKRVFFEHSGVVFIFTEDNPEDRVFYELLLRRLEDDNLTIEKVQPLGSKQVVLETAMLDKSPETPSLYIVDGDIKLMLGQELETDNLIALDRYCIENYLCCEQGIAQYLHVKSGESLESVKSKLSFEELISKNGKILLKLYYRYAVSIDLDCGHTFKKFEFLYSTRYNRIDSAKLKVETEAVESAIKNKLKQSGVRAFKKEMEARIEKVRTNNPYSIETIIKVLSGKDQLLPMVTRKIKTIDASSRGLDPDELKRLLAEKVSLDPLQRIKAKLLDLI